MTKPLPTTDQLLGPPPTKDDLLAERARHLLRMFRPKGDALFSRPQTEMFLGVDPGWLNCHAEWLARRGFPEPIILEPEEQWSGSALFTWALTMTMMKRALPPAGP